MRLHPHAAALVFDSWSPDKIYPDKVGEIRCCGKLLVARDHIIICETCGTMVDTSLEADGKWKILRIKGRDRI